MVNAPLLIPSGLPIATHAILARVFAGRMKPIEVADAVFDALASHLGVSRDELEADLADTAAHITREPQEAA